MRMIGPNGVDNNERDVIATMNMTSWEFVIIPLSWIRRPLSIINIIRH